MRMRNREHRFYADAWDIVIRRASVTGNEESGCNLKTIEDLLIKSHKPPYNNHGVNRSIERSGSEKQAHLIL